jgi:hypothetical protein
MKLTRTFVAITLLAAGSAAFAQTAISNKGAAFPININQPGSYKLVSNLVVPVGSVGISIIAPNVTLDLNGFTISGPVTCSTAGVCSMATNANHGIKVSAPNAVVRNGAITGFQGNGVDVFGNSQLEDLMVSQNAGYGVYSANMLAAMAQVNRIRATLNKMSGMYVYGGIVTDSIATANGQIGIYVNQASVFDSMSTENGTLGVFVGSRGLLRGVRAADNAGGNFGGNFNSAGGNMNDWTLF